ncbi:MULTISPECIES: NAD-dependent deacylase [unclassified Anaerobiospirillum]|uniref:NAD-dependent deacylase n=1 Tax=unclassified Anaerobiospirillum TaxID=2647410 RepID=UPI001FF5BB29|nr:MULTISPECIES: NAD-dependent deacylase [unclassified Anaerobiospirillum]MCK0534483.1 NAD-dependent deacylase [Anaerobiospirillum sp. NML120511]MCK0539854.1 NAD-dependent deacylase [Anaerobiospirillum sp. NML02-A-032]
MQFRNIAVLTGAGISAESGVPVFRSEDGLWENHRVEDVATYMGFEANKTLVHDFYNNMRESLKTKEPNPAHRALADLEQYVTANGGNFTLITQNIDDLHERGGSKNIIHMHGQLNSLLCEHCGKRIEFHERSTTQSVCPHCNSKAMRPDIVWFGEMPYQMDTIESVLLDCDLFISIGTSGVVYPAAGFVSICHRMRKPTIEFNLEPSAVRSQFDKAFYGKAGTTLPAFVAYLKEHDALPDTLN